MNVAQTAGGMDRPGSSTEVLSPLDRTSEVLFGLIMALTFTGSLSVATADRAEVREMLIGALGCNIAWGLVDAVMYLMATAAERGREIKVLNDLRQATDAAQARQLIADAMPPVVASAMKPEELDVLRGRLTSVPVPPRRFLIATGDLRGAVLVFLLVFLATLPVALPFAFFKQAHLALRVSNGIALGMLFLGGIQMGRYSGRSPFRVGVITLAIGVVLVWATILLGG